MFWGALILAVAPKFSSEKARSEIQWFPGTGVLGDSREVPVWVCEEAQGWGGGVHARGLTMGAREGGRGRRQALGVGVAVAVAVAVALPLPLPLTLTRQASHGVAWRGLCL